MPVVGREDMRSQSTFWRYCWWGPMLSVGRGASCGGWYPKLGSASVFELGVRHWSGGVRWAVEDVVWSLGEGAGPETNL